MLKLAQLTADRKTMTVTYRGEPLDITYKPSGYTPRLEAEFRASSPIWQADITVKALLDFVTGWSLTHEVQVAELDGEGKPRTDDDGEIVWKRDRKGEVVTKTEEYPLTVEALGELPFDFLNFVFNSVTLDMRSTGEAEASSADG